MPPLAETLVHVLALLAWLILGLAVLNPKNREP